MRFSTLHIKDQNDDLHPSASNENVVDVNVDRSEECEETIIGDDLSALTNVSDIQTHDDEVSSATEGLSMEMNGEGTDNLFNAGGQCQEDSNKVPPPCVSRVFDADCRAYIRIIFTDDYCRWSNVLVAILDSASENDIVEIVIDNGLSKSDQGIANRTFLSAINRCKAKVITCAGTLMTMSRVALWLSGDECRISPFGWICLKQIDGAACGDAADVIAKAKEVQETWIEFRDFIVQRGLFTQEELDAVFEHRGRCSLSGDELREKVTKINSHVA